MDHKEDFALKNGVFTFNCSTFKVGRYQYCKVYIASLMLNIEFDPLNKKIPNIPSHTNLEALTISIVGGTKQTYLRFSQYDLEYSVFLWYDEWMHIPLFITQAKPQCNFYAIIDLISVIAHSVCGSGQVVQKRHSRIWKI